MRTFSPASLCAFSLLCFVACSAPKPETYVSASRNSFLLQLGKEGYRGEFSYLYDECFGIAVGKKKNEIYCGGATAGSIGESNSGEYDAFIMRVSDNGVLALIQQLGGLTRYLGYGISDRLDACYATAIDLRGDIFCAGTTSSELKGPSSNKGKRDAFVAKFSSAGRLLWISQFGSSENDACTSVAVDMSGDVYCAGYTYGAMTSLLHGGSKDAFVVKLSGKEGNQYWLTQLNDDLLIPNSDLTKLDECTSIAVNMNGESFCAGQTRGSLGEDGNGADAFVMKLDVSGTIDWIRQLGQDTVVPGGDSTKFDRCNAIALGDNDSVYCGGFTYGSLGEANNNQSMDAFVMKLDKDGSILWIRQLGAVTLTGGDSSADEVCNGLAIDADGNVYCGGWTTGSLGEANGGEMDIFVMKLTSDGDLVWIRQLGAETPVPGSTNQSEWCNAIALDSKNNVYCAGATFGSLGGTAGGEQDAFILKLNSDGELE